MLLLLWNSKVHNRLDKCPLLIPVLSHLNPVHHTLTLNCSNILLASLMFPKQFLLLLLSLSLPMNFAHANYSFVMLGEEYKL